MSRTTFDVPITSILDDGIVNVWLDIDMEREGWLTTVQQSVLTVTYLYVPGNLPPFQPELLASNNGEASIDRPLEVTVSGPNPPDPNEGDTVSYSYRWYVDVGQGYYIDDEFAGKPNHTGSSIPASSLELGEKWCVQVTPMDQHHFAGPSATVYWAPVAEINYPPVAVAGNDQVVEQTSPQGAVAALSAAASSDAEGDALGYLWTWNGGSADTMEFEALFPAGVTELTLRVYEVATGIWAEDSVLVTVVDTTPPVLTVPAPQTVEQVGPAGTPLVLTASATDAADPDVEIVSDAPAVFPAGVTIVTFTATDDAGNVSVATTTVTVVDTTPPALTIPADMVVEQQGPEGSVVALHASATDAVDLDVELWSDAPAVFPAGVTTVTFHARDDAGNQSSSSMTVTVRDTTAPTIVVDQYATLLWPPNHRMERIASVSASDAVDPNAELVIRVTHNQNPHDNVGVGDGHTLFDWLVEENGDVWVRAERDGRGNDRVYTISVTATDAAGNVATRTFTVTVPHSNPY
ncbi:MAG: HYR domain-containing protein [Spirochaetales bacterium]|nr:HYR domain-containing protein [Spirochaetales bacterium]